MAIYDITAPRFWQMLEALHGMLLKAERGAAEPGDSPDDLLNARLAPDMHDLSMQIRFVCTQAQEAIARLTRAELPALAAPTDFAEAKGLIASTQQLLKAADRAAINDNAQGRICIELDGGLTFDMTGEEYVVDWAIPQFYFHLVTAYNILRNKGVPLGKADYVPHMFAYSRHCA
ncbi:DUF1993 domain-containing protein [Pseudomonas yamanorum]|uniref:DUF1993 domain-containing protein n=1 Tax=Pseudomonas yamanorum TaxID=515393 RepID=UPI0015A37EC6|nr:DUF1993 domain-containing protein [Pseudomonas yamanorum]NVZ81216.1 DUF1993 domain-containing protein [Pseudomonas yamanorum]